MVIDKPAGWTSHQVVVRVRRLLGTRKVGHAGTLDPDATGVLLLGVGRATRLLRYLSPLGKSYLGEVVLGVETDTLDAAGVVTARHDMTGITLADVARVAADRFTGPIEQIPPMVSAVKVGGERLHKLARAGITVEREPRPVTIHALSVEAVDGMDGMNGPAGGAGVFRIRVECSSGTYVRSLAADLGAALGGGAHLRNLRRTAVGPFTLDEAVPLDKLGPDALRPMTEAVRHLRSMVADERLVAAAAVGKVLERAELGVDGDGGSTDDGPWALLSEAGELLAIYEPHRGSTVKPAIVVAPR
jgi:tRNA pseudouridine55 synthase